MYTTIISDFSRVIIKPIDKGYLGGLNAFHRELIEKFGERYNIFEYFEVNNKLLDFYLFIKTKYSVNLFTTDIIQNHPLLRPKLDDAFGNIFAANDHGLNKKDPTAYLFIADKLKTSPQNIIYIDDQMSNIEAATSAGFKALHYEGDDDFIIKTISSLLSIN